MNFFTRKSVLHPTKGKESFDDHQTSTGFSQKRALIISLFFALLLLIGSLVKAEGSTVPGMQGLVTGQKNVCAYVGTLQVVNYSISPVQGAQLYLWKKLFALNASIPIRYLRYPPIQLQLNELCRWSR